MPAAAGGAVSGQSVIELTKRVSSHRGDDHLYSELSDLIGGLSTEEIRAVVEAAEQLPNQRDQNVCLSLLMTRWAKVDPQAAANYAQSNGVRGETLIPDVVTAWAEQDPAGASAWVTQLAPGKRRKRAVEAPSPSSRKQIPPERYLSLTQVLSSPCARNPENVPD